MSGTGATWDSGADRLVAVGHLKVEGGWEHVPHAHDFHQLMLVLGGSLRVRLPDGTLRVKTGSWISYAPGVEHAETALGRGADFVYLAFTGPTPPWPVTAFDEGGRGRQLVRWLVEEHRSPGPRRTQREGALLRLVLEEFHAAAGHRLPAFVEAARALLAEDPARPLSLADLAAAAGMAPAHFGRRYKAATGTTPMADLRRRRVEAARDLLVTTALPLRAIAERCGFCDEYHLSKACRRELGKAPGWWR